MRLELGAERRRYVKTGPLFLLLWTFVYGLWLIVPFNVFAISNITGQNAGVPEYVSATAETVIVVMALSISVIGFYAMAFDRFSLLKNVAMLNAAMWIFVLILYMTYGLYTLTVPMAGFFALASAYYFIDVSVSGMDRRLVIDIVPEFIRSHVSSSGNPLHNTHDSIIQ